MQANKNISLKSQQFLISQIFHDLVSPLSSLFVGIELLSDSDQDVLQILNTSVNQTRSILMLFRSMFGYTNIGTNEGIQYIHEYIKSNTSINFLCNVSCDKTKSPVQLFMILCLWLSKQSMTKSGKMSFSISDSAIEGSLCDTKILANRTEDAIILNKKTLSSSPKESYACYVASLLQENEMWAHITRNLDSISLKVEYL